MNAARQALGLELTKKAEAYIAHHHRQALRERIEAALDEVHALIATLDRLDGDCDLEEDEHGGDVNDLPHDACDEGNDEFDLGWTESIVQGIGMCGQGNAELSGDIPGGSMIAAE